MIFDSETFLHYYDHLLRTLYKIIHLGEFRESILKAFVAETNSILIFFFSFFRCARPHFCFRFSFIIKMTKNQYLKVGQSAKNRLFGIAPIRRLSVVASNRHSSGRPIQMLVSEKFTLSNSEYSFYLFKLEQKPSKG